LKYLRLSRFAGFAGWIPAIVEGVETRRRILSGSEGSPLDTFIENIRG